MLSWRVLGYWTNDHTCPWVVVCPSCLSLCVPLLIKLWFLHSVVQHLPSSFFFRIFLALCADKENGIFNIFFGSWGVVLKCGFHILQIFAGVDTRISCVDTRDFLCRHNIPFYSYIIINVALKHFHTRLGIFSFIYTYIVDYLHNCEGLTHSPRQIKHTQ